MKKYIVLLMAIYLLVLTGCMPNLKPRKPMVSLLHDNIQIKICNTGLGHAGSQLTYIEINDVNAPASVKPQSQYTVRVPAIKRWSSWKSNVIPFGSFSTPSGINLQTMTKANVVVNVDAKMMVKESNEKDNIYDANH